MRRRFSYANVAATLALVFSMSGGALAAKHYLISSTKQISPKVLAKLKGRQGTKGPTGATGPAGTAGVKGEKGETGEPGPSHAYSAEGTATAEVKVPAGSYVVDGGGWFNIHNGTHAGNVECTLNGPEGEIDSGFTSVPTEGWNFIGGKYGDASLSDRGAVTLKAAGALTESCTQDIGSEETVEIHDTRITAIQVGAVN